LPGQGDGTESFGAEIQILRIPKPLGSKTLPMKKWKSETKDGSNQGGEDGVNKCDTGFPRVTLQQRFRVQLSLIAQARRRDLGTSRLVLKTDGLARFNRVVINGLQRPKVSAF